jgi:hypothetical protein
LIEVAVKIIFFQRENANGTNSHRAGLNVGDKIVTKGSFLLRAEMLK